MSDTDIVDAELVGTDIAVVESNPPATLFGTDDPVEFIASATRTATALANVVRSQKLITRIQQSDHVRVEGWTLLGSMLGVYAATAWTRPLEQDGAPFGWEARVEARDRAGVLVGAAEAQCTREERTWKGRDDYALRSMAQTRATSKALRQPLGFVMQLAGFNPTPAEEMPQQPRSRGVPPPTMEDTFGPEPPPSNVISDAQLKRLHTIASKHRVPKDEAKRIVVEVAGVESSKDIPRSLYDAVVAVLQAYEPVSQFQAPEGAA